MLSTAVALVWYWLCCGCLRDDIVGYNQLSIPKLGLNRFANYMICTQENRIYFGTIKSKSQGNPKKLWRTLSTILCRDQLKSGEQIADHVTAENFAKTFVAKVEMVRQSTASSSYPEFDHPGCSTSMDHFNDINTEFARRLLTQAANKNCALDPAQMWIVKRFVDELAPFVVAYVNVFFQTGWRPY